jgi:D-3-phosphoglycerate dehydrogenase
MKNVLITTSSFADEAPELLASLESSGLKAVLNPFRRKLTESEVDALIQEHQPVGMIAGVEPLTRQVMQKASFLKVISRCGIGMDAVDLAAAKELAIMVTNTPDAPTIPVGELTIGMILTLLRSIHVSDSSIRTGGWERPMGALLHDKTVGIIGCGRIGTYVAKILAAFGCRLLGCDPCCASHQCIGVTDLKSLLQEADIVTLHLPYTEACRHLINAERIALMKQGAVLVHASRGGLVDEDALAAALQSGKLAGAAIDCFEREPYTGPLAQLKNTLLTGHIGSYAREGRMIMEQQAMDNLLKALREKQVIA